MNTTLQKEIDEHRVQHDKEVKIHITPGQYKEIERVHGYGSVVNFIQNMIDDLVYRGEVHRTMERT